MRCNAAHLPSVMLLKLAVGITITRTDGVYLGEYAHGYVVEEAGDEGRAIDKPLKQRGLLVILSYA